MFQEGFRAINNLSEENCLPPTPPECQHKVDFVALIELGLSETEANNLIVMLQKLNNKEFQLSQIAELSSSSIKNIANDKFSRTLILWVLLRRLIESHSQNCDSNGISQSEYVEIEEMQPIQGDFPISELNLSVRSQNALRREGIDSLFRLSQVSEEELFDMRNLGKDSVNEIISLLEKLGFKSNSESLAIPTGILASKISLENLNLSTRVYNSLKRINIQNLGQLSALSDTELRNIRNFGEKCILEVQKVLTKASQIRGENVNVVDSAAELSIGDLYAWAKSGLQEELEILGLEIREVGHLKVDYQTIRNPDSIKKSRVIYKDCNTLNEVHAKLIEQLANSEKNSKIEQSLLNVDTFSLDISSYKQNCSNTLIDKSKKESLLEYENNFSDDSVDLLKFDDFTFRILKLPMIDKEIYLIKETYFEVLDEVKENFVIDKNLWNLISRVCSFHDEYKTFPNLLGLIISLHLGSEEKKRQVWNELANHFEFLRPNNAERDLKILRMRINSETLEEIGNKVGLTRERVRQILVQISPDLMSTIELLKSGVQQKQGLVIKNKLEEIFHQYGAIYCSELAFELGLNEGDALQLVPKKYKKFIFDNSPELVSRPTWSKEDCLNALRKAGTYFFPVKQSDYDDLITIGEIKGPSLAYMYWKIGRWSDLCVEAGIEFVPSVRTEYSRIWSEEELISYICRFFKEPEISGSYASYDAWRERQPDHVPSGVLIRNTFGSWSNVKRKALEGLRREKGLGVE